ncbi:MAG: hypothetical protein LBH81_00455 [Rickettsiales bacterium]|jgi:hypothetical protein|nr:hypothetical protein [Rickettsiales bacterium]
MKNKLLILPVVAAMAFGTISDVRANELKELEETMSAMIELMDAAPCLPDDSDREELIKELENAAKDVAAIAEEGNDSEQMSALRLAAKFATAGIKLKAKPLCQ